MIKIGILREGKIPPDARVPLSPAQCVQVQALFPNVQVIVEPSPIRCFEDAEYAQAGIAVDADLSACDILLGVKEVPIDWLRAEKTYLFFSHTMKQQPYNRPLLQAILENKIRLIDYEALTDERGNRLIAFGFYAGVVGAHNALWTYAQRTHSFHLPRMKTCHDYEVIKAIYKETTFPPVRIVLTGNGRVAAGAIQNLHDMGIRQVSPEDFLHYTYDEPVFTQVHAQDYARHRDGRIFDKGHYYIHGEQYVSIFAPYTQQSDIFINCIYYDKKGPEFFSVADMSKKDFRIQVIADVTCDIMPGASVPSTIQPSTILDPVYGFDPKTGNACAPFQHDKIDVMAIDNLPSELPRDASVFFGRQLIENILTELLLGRESEVVQRGMIAEKGELTHKYAYLKDYVEAGI